MRRILAVLFIAVLLSMNLGSGFTQETQEPLLYALSLIPDTDESRSDIIMFSDMEALETAYGTERLASPDEFHDLQFVENPEEDPALIGQLAWWRTMRNFTLPSDFRGIFRDDGDTPIGITFFQIDAAISYGMPPDHALMLFGDFDLSAIRTAYHMKGFAQQKGAVGEIWCSAGGCEAGYETNPRESEPENPFGGDIGRNQPVAIGESYLMSSPQFVMVENQTAVASGNMDSLADELRYQAAVGAVTQEGTLVQAFIMDQAMLIKTIQQLPPVLALSRDPEEMAAILRAFLEHYEILPIYNLLLVADVVTETDQVVKMALVFSDAADAEIAAEVLETRLQNYISLFYKRSLMEILTGWFTMFHEPTLYSGVEGYTVVVLTFSTHRPTDLNELIAVTTLSVDNDSNVLSPGKLYGLFYTMVSQEDTGWLSTVPREEIETLIQELESSN